MATLDHLSVAPEIVEAIRMKLQDAPAPLKLTDVAKGLPRPKKVKAAEFGEDVRRLLEEELRLGRAFCYPSAKNAALRYWARDEKQALRDKAVELTVTPRPMSALKTALGKEVKGADGAFVEAVVRELVRDDKLFEHPPKTKKSGPLFGSSPLPPPLAPLERSKHKKALDKLVADCRKLLTATAVRPEDLLSVLRARMSEAGSAEEPVPTPAVVPASRNAPAATLEAVPAASRESDVEELIFKAVQTAPVLALAELRREMPPEYRGRTFDEAVLRLADQQRVIISQDADPFRFSAEERAEQVQDGGLVFTTIMRRS
jgi:hypothetical protein